MFTVSNRDFGREKKAMTRRRRRQRDFFDSWLEELLEMYGLDGRRKRRKKIWF